MESFTGFVGCVQSTDTFEKMQPALLKKQCWQQAEQTITACSTNDKTSLFESDRLMCLQESSHPPIKAVDLQDTTLRNQLNLYQKRGFNLRINSVCARETVCLF